MTATRVPLAVAGALALLGCAAAPAAAHADPPQPPRQIAGKVVRGGADGTRHEVFCPAMQHVYAGGYELTASQPGTRLSEDPADVLENRPNDNATGWVVAVHKTTWWLRPQTGQNQGPHMPGGKGGKGGRTSTGRKGNEAGTADLTIHLTCSDEATMHGM